MKTVNISLKRSQYDGADGTSLTLFRGQQMNDILHALENCNEDSMTYASLQDYIENSLELDSSKVRTLFPLLMKVGFCIDYTNSFSPRELFTNTGRAFIFVCDSITRIEHVKEYQNDEKLLALKGYFENLKKYLVLQGLKFLHSNYPDHRINYTIELWKKLGALSEMEYYYALYIKDEPDYPNIESVCNKIRENRQEGVVYSCNVHAFSYQKAILVEAGLVDKENNAWCNQIKF